MQCFAVIVNFFCFVAFFATPSLHCQLTCLIRLGFAASAEADANYSKAGGDLQRLCMCYGKPAFSS